MTFLFTIYVQIVVKMLLYFLSVSFLLLPNFSEMLLQERFVVFLLRFILARDIDIQVGRVDVKLWV